MKIDTKKRPQGKRKPCDLNDNTTNKTRANYSGQTFTSAQGLKPQVEIYVNCFQL